MSSDQPTNGGVPRRIIVAGATTFTLGLIWCLGGCSADVPPSSTVPHGAYATNFPLTENPISEGGHWINGRAAGIDWADIRTAPGYAFGTESGKVRYGDSTALLSGTWAPNQMAQATVHTVNQNNQIFEEVELRLRSSLSAHSATGYEVNFRCTKMGNAYTQIVRWNGRLGSFKILKSADGSRFGVADGDVVKATIVNNLITSYINGIEVLQTTDNTYRSGSPGMGFYLEGASGVNADFGFTKFAATDGPGSDLQTPAGNRGSVWRSPSLLSGISGRSQTLLFGR